MDEFMEKIYKKEKEEAFEEVRKKVRAGEITQEEAEAEVTKIQWDYHRK